jgi:predicted RNA-binding protein with PIN domain
MGCDILVDGYNVIKNNEPFRSAQKHSLEYARTLLVKQLNSRYRHTPYQVTVVFDGDSVHEQTLHEQRVRIVYSRRGETADCVITRLAAQAREAGREVVTVSDDLEVRHGVSGGEVRSTGQLAHHLNAPPPDIARKFRHRQQAIRTYGLNPHLKDRDEEDSYCPSYRGKKSRRK